MCDVVEETALTLVATHQHTYEVGPARAQLGNPPLLEKDLGALDAAVKRLVLDRVDHYDLSRAVPALTGVTTTGENLARAFWQWLEPALAAGTLRRVAVVETDNNIFEYRG